MKCFLLLLLFPIFAIGQTVYDSIPYNEFGKAGFAREFNVNSSKDSLFDLAKTWASTLLKNQQQLEEDPSKGTILFSSNVDFNHAQQYVHKAANWKTKEIRQNEYGGLSNLKYTVKVWVENNKARLVMENLSYKRSFSNEYSELDRSTVEAIRNYPVKTLEDQANVATMEALYRGILKTVAQLQEMFAFYLKKR